MTVSEKLRLVQGLHSHAEIFGFKWDDDSDWTWHDVVCKIADEVDAENAKLREYVQTLEAANIDVTSRLQDYIGQYDPTDAFVIEAKADNAKLREERDGWKKLCVDQEVAHVRRAEYLESENASLRELCETFGMIANDQVCDYYERDEMLARANATARELEVEL